MFEIYIALFFLSKTADSGSFNPSTTHFISKEYIGEEIKKK